VGAMLSKDWNLHTRNTIKRNIQWLSWILARIRTRIGVLG
jgi:hypothetical protein